MWLSVRHGFCPSVHISECMWSDWTNMRLITNVVSDPNRHAVVVKTTLYLCNISATKQVVLVKTMHSWYYTVVAGWPCRLSWTCSNSLFSPIIPGIMLDSRNFLLFQKLCWHNNHCVHDSVSIKCYHYDIVCMSNCQIL